MVHLLSQEELSNMRLVTSFAKPPKKGGSKMGKVSKKGKINVTSPEYALRRCKFVFVYGTLKREYRNHHLLKDAKFIGVGTTYKRFRLFDVGFPLAIPSEDGYRVKGEVYKVKDAQMMSSLDKLEGYPYFYKRQVIKVEVDGVGDIEAWIYYVTSPQGKEIKPNKDGIVEWPAKSYIK